MCVTVKSPDSYGSVYNPIDISDNNLWHMTLVILYNKMHLFDIEQRN